jgi:Arc/MetJ-type ribon-helix-helix transcriptional regulator
MTVINFAVPRTLEKRIDKTIREKGFASKAEFFRFAAVHFLDIVQRPIVSEDDRFSFLTEALRREVAKKYQGKNIPSITKQLADV